MHAGLLVFRRLRPARNSNGGLHPYDQGISVQLTILLSKWKTTLPKRLPLRTSHSQKS